MQGKNKISRYDELQNVEVILVNLTVYKQQTKPICHKGCETITN
jgi:hypothetical protein